MTVTTRKLLQLGLLGLLSPTMAFLVPTPFSGPLIPHLSASATPSEEQMRKILQEEAMNVENLKASAKEMQNLKPGQIDQMIREMESMPSWQKDQLQKMGMDPEIMMASMQQMKQNPELLKTMANAMAEMTPQELMEQSRIAQEQMKRAQAMGVIPNVSSSSSSSLAIEDAVVVKEDDEEKTEEEEEDSEPIEPDPQVLDAMYEVAKIMGNGRVTFAAFCTLPVITTLAGTGEDDLNSKELKECWNKGSLGAGSVDRVGFERVWREIQDNYYNDIVEEARLRMGQKNKKRGSKAKTSAATPSVLPVVGANVSPELLQQQLKNMSDDDMKAMFDTMANMTPEMEARMKAMGTDPTLLKKSAEMMKNNPLLRKAAQTMMKNTTPEQMMKASQEAQERMRNMSDEEKRRLMDGMGV